jgi:hypothetical protein
VAIILHGQQVKPVAGGWAIVAQKLPIVADWRMLFAEYPIVGRKFEMIYKFV